MEKEAVPMLGLPAAGFDCLFDYASLGTAAASMLAAVAAGSLHLRALLGQELVERVQALLPFSAI